MAEVMLVRWPEDGADGERLARNGVAVLYVLDGDHPPPAPTTCLEDWVRVPGDERDLRARVAALELRSLAHHAPPRVDGEGRLRYRGSILALAPGEVGPARVLTERFGDVVPDDDLASAGRDVLRLTMARLRSKVRDIGLNLRRVRRQGYMLQAK
jgi:hypothetical protein